MEKKRVHIQPTDEEILSISQAAQILGVGRHSIYNYIKKGFFKSYKIGVDKETRKSYILRSEIMAALKKGLE